MVHELQDDGRDLVMEKVDGPNMAQAIEKKPWKARSFGQTAGRAPWRRARAARPDDLRRAPGGRRLPPLRPPSAERDPVPRRARSSSTGRTPAAGRPGDDVARAWALMACAEVQVSPFVRPILTRVRRSLVDGFVDAAGRDEARACLPFAVELTLLDPHISDASRPACGPWSRRRPLRPERRPSGTGACGRRPGPARSS